MAPAMESWDDDDDFQGDFQGFGNSVGTAQSISSRLSIRSESVAGDDDWNLVLQPNDEQSTNNALQSAKHAGIPLPAGIDSSALLGGAIKRLGKKQTRQKVEDDWENDMEMGDAPLTLKPRVEKAPSGFGDDDGFDDFEGDFEGSLGTRFAGTQRDARESSVSAMSPSIGSPMVEESDQDEAGGLDIPDGPLDFDAILKKRRAAEAELSEASMSQQPSPAIEQPATLNTHKKSKLLADTNEDFLDGLDFSGLPTLNVQKRTVNKNVKIKDTGKPASPAHQRPATTLNFHDKPIDRPTHMRSHLPRPVSGSKPGSRLEPVLENGTSTITRERRQQVASGNSSLLRNKRSAPALRSQAQQSSIARPPVPFLPSGGSLMQPTHASAQRAMPYHIRRDSDPNNRRGAQSPPMRSHSRLSNAFVPDTPSRVARPRADLAPAALAREAQSKKNLTKPSRRRNFGDGTELEHFDDLRTNTEKESKYTKQPIARGPPKLGVRHAHSRSDIKDPLKRTISIPDRMTTPAPPRTPASPTRGFHDVQAHTPSYLRDTAASRIARESRAVNTNPRPRSEGPLMPVSTNWKAQIAARSPHTSPSASKHKPKKSQPQLIKGIGIHIAKTEKGMTYNPHTLRWEGNENTLTHFDIPPPLETPTPTGNQPQTSYMDRMDTLPPPSASPPRPALIAPMSAANLQVNGGMVFDPQQMKWLKIKNGRDVSGQMSPSVTDEEEEDVFAGLEDLKDSVPTYGATSSVTGMQSPVSMANTGLGEVHEEFDLGPRFIHTQRDEEVTWRRKCESWFPENGGPRVEDDRWRWAARDLLAQQPGMAM